MKGLYKAKRIDNGEWVEGFYFCMVHDDGRHTHHFIMPIGCDLSLGTPIEKIQVEIDINTLCRDAETTDKNGCKIWEHDILEQKYQNGPSDYYECVWLEDEKGFAFKHNNDYTNAVDCYDDYDEFFMGVVGNIFDNAELLES